MSLKSFCLSISVFDIIWKVENTYSWLTQMIMHFIFGRTNSACTFAKDERTKDAMIHQNLSHPHLSSSHKIYPNELDVVFIDVTYYNNCTASVSVLLKVLHCPYGTMLLWIGFAYYFLLFAYYWCRNPLWYIWAGRLNEWTRNCKYLVYIVLDM